MKNIKKPVENKALVKKSVKMEKPLKVSCDKSLGHLGCTLKAMNDSGSMIVDHNKNLASQALFSLSHMVKNYTEMLGKLQKCRDFKDFMSAQEMMMKGNMELSMNSMAKCQAMMKDVQNKVSERLHAQMSHIHV